MNSTVRHPITVRRFALSRFRYLRQCFLVLLVTLYSGRLPSQTATDDQSHTKTLRFDLTPLVGYRTSITFPTGQDNQESGPRLLLDAKPSYGVAFGIRLDEENLVEIRWARQNTNVHLEGGTSPPGEKVVLDQFHGDFTHEYILENWYPRARPFVMGSIGATHVSGGANNNFTRFSFGLGGGVKVYFTRHVGLRVQAEWLPIVVDPGVGTFVCGGGCAVRLTSSAVSQGEIAVGPVFRF